ncbi:hypothetical protein [Romboutsia timonensis]|nr:hypothetical protein [Romboutsia timonensis]
MSTDDIRLYISGNSENKKLKSTNNNKNIMAHLPGATSLMKSIYVVL